MATAGFIIALSVFCGAQAVAPAYKGPGNVVSIIAYVWFLAELLKMAARNKWRPLRAWPKPNWGVTEVALTSIAVLVGVVGPRLLVSHSNSALVSWGLGGAVTVIVAACLFAAKASYWRRASRAWQR